MMAFNMMIMKRANSWWAIAILCVLGSVWQVRPANAQEDLQQQETKLLTQAKGKAVAESYLLAQLAFVREQRGRYNQAIATWRLIKRMHYGKRPPNESSAPDYTYGQIADFCILRLRRKKNLSNHSSKLSKQLRRKIAKAATDFGDQIGNYTTISQLDLSVQADLDGDSIDEFFFVGKHGPLGKRTTKSMGIAKWDGAKYQVLWQSRKSIPEMIHVVDENGDGWKEIHCGFEPETDNAATLHFNGTTAMIAWILR